MHTILTTICMVGQGGREHLFLIMGGSAVRMGSATTTIDLMPKIFAALDYRISTWFSSWAFELFFPSSLPIIDNIPSVLHTCWLRSGKPPSPTATGIFGRMVGRLSLILASHQCVYLLLCLTLTLKKLSQWSDNLLRCQHTLDRHWGCRSSLVGLLCNLLTLSWRHVYQSINLYCKKAVKFSQTAPN